MVAAVIGFAVVAGLLTMLPGIDTALVLRASIIRGPALPTRPWPEYAPGYWWGVAAAIG